MMKEIYDSYAKSSVFSHHTEQGFLSLAEQYLKKRYRPYLPIDKEASILEIGCGQGRFIKLLQEEGYTALYGIDVSADQIAYGKEKWGLQCLEQVDAISFLKNAKENTYASILLLDVLEHLDVQTSIEVLRLARQALCPKGSLIIQVPNGLCPLMPQMYGDITHHRCYTVYSLKQSLILGGFTDLSFVPQPPVVHGVKSAIRRVLWDFCLNPLICCYMLVTSGTLMGGVYTPNLLAIARK